MISTGSGAKVTALHYTIPRLCARVVGNSCSWTELKYPIRYISTCYVTFLHLRERPTYNDSDAQCRSENPPWARATGTKLEPSHTLVIPDWD